MTPPSGVPEREPWDEPPDEESPEEKRLVEYMGKFRPARSGRGKIYRARLDFPYFYWQAARWVGRQPTGGIAAVVYAPTRPSPQRNSIGKFLEAGDGPVMRQQFESEGAAFAWLLETETSGELQKRASKQIEEAGYAEEVISWDPPVVIWRAGRRAPQRPTDPPDPRWDRFG